MPALLAVTWLIVVFWIFEVIPLAVTALLPLIAFPVTGVADIRTAAAPYAHPIIYLFLGGFMIAYGLEKHALHRRFALWLLGRVGHHPRHILWALIAVSAGLSMWISNTATTLMLLPLTLSIVQLVERQGGGEAVAAPVFLLSVAYAANIGGTLTPVGTPPNVLFLGFMEEAGLRPPSFAEWMQYVIPWGLGMLAFLYWYQARRLRRMPQLGAGWAQLLRDEQQKLGAMTPTQRRVLGVFLLTVAGWIFRPLIGRYLGVEGLHDAVIAMAGGFLMFVVPSAQTEGKGRGLLVLEDIARLPWPILILFGGALSMASALKAHGIFEVVGARLTEWVPPMWLPVVVIGVAIFATEIMSNSALTSIFIPILLALPAAGVPTAWAATLGASCAFMMPVATPPNAIVFSAPGMGRIQVMMRAGWWLNLAAWASLGLWYWWMQ